MLDKTTLIENIRHINQTASREWLDRFEIPALRLYLDHLQRTLEPRGVDSYWVRQTNSAAIVTRGARL